MIPTWYTIFYVNYIKFRNLILCNLYKNLCIKLVSIKECRVLFQNKINLRYCASGWFYYGNILRCTVLQTSKKGIHSSRHFQVTENITGKFPVLCTEGCKTNDVYSPQICLLQYVVSSFRTDQKLQCCCHRSVVDQQR